MTVKNNSCPVFLDKVKSDTPCEAKPYKYKSSNKSISIEKIVARRTPMERHAPEEEEPETEACRSAQGMMRPM